MKAAFSNWRYIFKSEDIRRKLLISLILLAVYRIAANFPVPGVDLAVLREINSQMAQQGGFVSMLDLLSGGTITGFSLLSMGVYPYITAQIILQLLIPIIPALQRRMEEDPREGRKWMERWTYYLSVPMALLSAIGQISIFNNLTGQVVVPFGFSSTEAQPYLWLSSIAILAAMTAGTMFAIWLGELISEFGIRGQGLSLIIFAGIVSKMPANILQLLQNEADRWTNLIIIIVILVFTIAAIVFIQQGRRNVPVMYPGRRVGNRMSMPVKGSMPLMVNMAGMIPLIFAGAILQFPAIVSSLILNTGKITNEGVKGFFEGVRTLFNAGVTSSNWLYWVLYFLMVVLFTYFYADVIFTQQNYGENLKRAGAQIPGVNPGGATQRYLTKVLRRITLPGALFLGIVAIMPFLLTLARPQLGQGGLVLVSSAGLLIVVGVVRDTFLNIDAELKMHGYQDSVLVK